MIEQIKNPLYPDFSDREIVAIEDDYAIRFTDEELDKAARHLAGGKNIFADYGMMLLHPLAAYMEKHPELVPPREGYVPAFRADCVPVKGIDEIRKGLTFEVSLYWERKDSCKWSGSSM